MVASIQAGVYGILKFSTLALQGLKGYLDMVAELDVSTSGATLTLSGNWKPIRDIDLDKVRSTLYASTDLMSTRSLIGSTVLQCCLILI